MIAESAEYVDQSAYGLRFYLLQGAVDIEQYAVLQRTSFEWGGYIVEMGILGASHFVTLTDPSSKQIHEIFACADIQTDGTLISSGPLGDLSSEVTSIISGREKPLHYNFRPRLHSWTKAVDQELQTMKRASRAAQFDQNKYGLEHLFPSQGEGDKPPLTLVHAECNDQQLQIQTAHCYPNEDNIVFTGTNFKI